MKNILILTLLLLISCRLTGQTETKFDLKSQKEKLITYKVANNKGIILLTEKKGKGFDRSLIVRMLDTEGKLQWEKEIKSDQLSKGATPIELNVQLNDEMIYIFSKFDPNTVQDQYVSKITYSGEIQSGLTSKNAFVIADYGINPKGSYVIQNKNKGYKDTGIKKLIRPVNPSTLKTETEIPADLPALEDGEWHHLYNDDGTYYFYAFKKEYNEDHSMNCEFRQIGSDGKTIHTMDLKAFADHVKYPVPRIKYDGDYTPPFGEIYVDSSRKEIYLHGFYQTKKGKYTKDFGAAALEPEGYYICKYGFDGTLKWNKIYSIQQLIKMGCSLREKPALNEWKFVYFTVEKDGQLFIIIASSYDPFYNSIIADSTGNFITVVKGKSPKEEDYIGDRIVSENGDYNTMRCRLFWDLKNSEKINSVLLKASNQVKQKNGGNATNTNVDAYSFDKTTLVIQMRYDTGQLIVYSVAN